MIAALDQYVRVNGAPLSSGVTVPGGEFGAPRDYGPHAGWDYAFGGGASLTLQNGAQWLSSSRGSYGDATAFQTPDGNVYKIIHGTFEPGNGEAASAVQTAGGAAVDMSSGITASGGVEQAKAQLEGLNKERELHNEVKEKMAQLDLQIRQAEFTQSIRDQTDAIKAQTEGIAAQNRPRT